MFRIGQRVRKIANSKYFNSGDPIGKEYLIRSNAGPFFGLSRQPREYLLVDLHGIETLADGWQLEPIVDDGRQVISWADMKDLWQPKEFA